MNRPVNTHFAYFSAATIFWPCFCYRCTNTGQKVPLPEQYCIRKVHKPIYSACRLPLSLVLSKNDRKYILIQLRKFCSFLSTACNSFPMHPSKSHLRTLCKFQVFLSIRGKKLVSMFLSNFWENNLQCR